jgi:alcohol dehydrogenase (cytochrome c)
MLYDTMIDKVNRKVVGHFGRNGFYYSLDRTTGRFIKGSQYLNDVTWTKGPRSRDGQGLSNTTPSSTCRFTTPKRARYAGDPMKRTLPTWHGGIAHQPTSYNPIKKIAYGVGTEGCYSQNGQTVAFLSPEGGLDDKNSSKRTYSSDLYYGSITAFRHGESQGDRQSSDRHRDPLGDAVDRGRCGCLRHYRDGWIVAYNDETLEELWRFNVGTPLKGAPVTYSIGPKQYLAVQSGGAICIR